MDSDLAKLKIKAKTENSLYPTAMHLIATVMNDDQEIPDGIS